MTQPSPSLCPRPIRLAACACLLLAAMAPAQAIVLAHRSVSIVGSGGAGGAGSTASDMVFASFGSDGWGWAGGAGGVQGSGATTNTGGAALAANEALKFLVGSVADEMNSTYGAGNWSVDNLTLNFNSSYNRQNNARFGLGSGSYDVYWVGNDGWAQSTGTSGDRQLNPVYASSAASLLGWSGQQALLLSSSFTVTTVGAGFVNINLALPSVGELVGDIISASASSSNNAASLYLMGTSSGLGMIIFTGGQGQSLPTLSFDVITASVPEPGPGWLLASGLATLALLARRNGRRAA